MAQTRQRAGIAAAGALVLALALASPWGQGLEREVGLTWLYRLRGPVPVPAGPLIVGLDQASVNWLQFHADDLGTVAPELAPCVTAAGRAALARARNVGDLPRSLHACLIDMATARGAALVVFDILFAIDTPDDAVLAAAMARSGRVLLFERLRGEAESPGLPQLLHPHPGIAAAARGSGAFQIVAPTGTVVQGYVTRFEGFPGTENLAALAHRLTGGTVAADGPVERPIWLYGPPLSVPTVPLARVAAGGLPADLRGRVMFVGASDPGVIGTPDHFRVPVSDGAARTMGGVELMASAYANLAAGDDLRRPPPLAGAGLVAGFALVLGWLAQARGRRGVVAALVLPPLWALAAALAFAQGQLWLPLAVPVLLGGPLGLMLALVNRDAFARTLVARLAPRQIAADLLQGAVSERRAVASEPATIVFTDLVGSTDLGDRLDTSAYSAVMNHYYDTVTAVIEAEGGMVVEFMGDGILALFPLSVTGPGHAARACAAARAMGAALDAAGPPAGLGPGALRLRIGIHTGQTATGDIGARHRFSYKALGDTVNVAARLEELAKSRDTGRGSVILVSEATRSAAGLGPEVCEPLGPVTLRGKRTTISVAVLHS